MLKFIFLWLKRWLYRAFINTSSVGYGAATKSEATITLFVSINGTISKLKSKRDKIIFISIIANFCPIQFRAPALNGIKANGWREVSSREFVSWRNRSGLKTNGFLKFSGSVCITSVAFFRSIKVMFNYTVESILFTTNAWERFCLIWVTCSMNSKGLIEEIIVFSINR